MFQWYHSPARGIRVGYHPMSNSLVSSPIGWTHISCWLNSVTGVLRVEWAVNGRQDVAYLDLERPPQAAAPAPSTLEWFNDGLHEWQLDTAVNGAQQVRSPSAGLTNAWGNMLLSGDAFVAHGNGFTTTGKRGRLQPAPQVSGILAWAPGATPPQAVQVGLSGKATWATQTTPPAFGNITRPQAPARLGGVAAAVVIREVELIWGAVTRKVRLEFESDGDGGFELTDADMNSQALTAFMGVPVHGHSTYFDGVSLRNVDNDSRLCWCTLVDPNPKRQPTGCPKCGHAGTFIRMALCCPDHGAFGGM